MLVLSRHRDEVITIGDEVEIMVVDIRGDKVRLGIRAPQHVQVRRKEIAPRTLSWLLAMMVMAGAAWADPTISTTTFAGTCTAASCTGSGADPGIVDCRAPCPIVVDAGTNTDTTHKTGVAGHVAIRWGEKKADGASPSTGCDYDHGTLTITCPGNVFTTFSNEVNSISTLSATNWTASLDDGGAYYHDNVAGVHGKPVGVRVGGVDFTEGTLGSLIDGEWAYGCTAGDNATCTGTSRVYVQDAAGDPDGQASGFVEVIYGDGEYLEVQHSSWNSGNAEFIYVDYKADEGSVVLMTAPTGAGGNITDNTITVYQAVNPFNDLRYEWSTVCVGHSTCVAPVTNTDIFRPMSGETSLDMATFTGPVYPLVLGDVNTDGTISSFGTATITLTVYDDANGGGTDTQTIAVDDLTTAYQKEIYVDFTLGTDDANCLTSLRASDCTLVAPCKTWECAWSQTWRHPTASDAIRVYLKRGETFTVTTAPGADYSNKSNAGRTLLIAPYGSGADPIILQGGGNATFRFDQSGGTANHNVRVVDIEIQKTTGTANIFTMGATKSLLMRTTIDVLDVGSTLVAVERGGSNQDYDDTIYWDNRWTQRKGTYIVYDSGNSLSGRRVGYVGNYMWLDSDPDGNAVMRTNAIGPQVIAYNYMRTTDTTQSNPVLRLMYAEGVYCYRNHLIANGQNSGCWNNGCGLACGSGTSNDWLVDGDFCDQSGTVQGSAAGVFIAEKATGDTTPLTPGNVLFRNVIIKGGQRGFNCTSTQAPDLRVFHTTFYTAATQASGIPFIASTGSGSFANWKAINNALYVTQNDADNDMFVTAGNFDYLAGVQILDNVWFQGGSTGDFGNIVGVSYANDAAWSAASGKSAQDNDEADPLFANASSSDFRLCTAAGTPDASCSGASPCIDTGNPNLATVTKDFKGTTRGTGAEADAGAFDEASSATSGLTTIQKLMLDEAQRKRDGQ